MRGSRTWKCGCRENWSFNRRTEMRSGNFYPCKKHSTIRAVFGTKNTHGIVKQMMCEAVTTNTMRS